MDRRRFINFISATGIGSISGCLWSDDKGEYAIMQKFRLVNIRDNSAIMDVRIKQNNSDNIIHENSYELDSEMGGTEVECVWPKEPLRVMARDAADDDWSSFSTVGREGCLSVYAELNNQGTSFFISSEECPVRSPHCHTDV